MLISALRIELYPAGFVGVQPLAHFGGASLPGTSFSFLVAVDAHEFRTGEDDHELPFRLCGDKGIRLTACSSFGNLCASLLAQRNVQRQESTACGNFTAVATAGICLCAQLAAGR